MKLSVTSQFDATPEAVWAAFESDAFEARLAAESGMTKTILEERFEDGGVRYRRTHVERNEPLPAFVAKVLGSKTLTFNQSDRFDPATSTSEWTVEIPALGDRVSVSGRTSVEPTATGSQRVLLGEVLVRVRLVGGAIEKAVAGDFEKTAKRAVEIARSLL